MSNTAARLKTVQRLLGANEPTLNENNYRSSLMAALNHYNRENDDKDKQKWFCAYVAQTDKKLAVAFMKLDAARFRHAGIIARLIMREQPVDEKELAFLDDRFNEFTALLAKPDPVKVAPKQDDKPAAAVVSLQERIDTKAHELAGEFEGFIDDFILEDKNFDAARMMRQLNASGPVAKLIGSFFVKNVAEIEEALEGKDKQLVEGYSNFKKAKLKKLLALYQSIIDASQSQVQIAKAMRKPRTRKEKPAGVLVAKMKFKKEDTEYSLKSVPASGIINAQELWVFNTKYRKLQVYRAADPKGLSVKGTSIVGYDPENSGSKTMRKPEQAQTFATMSKRPLNQAYKSLTTAEAKVNGRVNEECILLKVFQ